MGDCDGEKRRRLTARQGLDMRPAWAPDGKRLAFTSVRAGNYEISVMAVTGQEDPFNVSDHPERDDFVTWHPRGQRLLWVAERGGRHNLVEWKLSAGP